MRSLVVFVLLVVGVSAYYPVLLMHGVTSGPESMRTLANTIEQYHPGQKTFCLDVHNDNASLVGLWDQIYDVHDAMLKVIAKDPELFKKGYHVVGHSQGTALLRGVLEMWPMNVVNFVSLAGALGGVYQCPVPALCESETKFMYAKEAQKRFSIANLWKTPQDQHERYLENNIYLGYFDNEINTNATMKKNFLRIKNLYLYGSDGDETIAPWYASLFDFLQTYNVTLPMQQQAIYTKDTFGLRTLDKEHRLFRIAVPGHRHCDWTDIPELQVKYVLDSLP